VAYFVTVEAQWIGKFTRFNGGVKCVGHMTVNGRAAIRDLAGTCTTTDGLVVSEIAISIWIPAAYAEVIHSPLGGSRNALRAGSGKRPKQDVTMRWEVSTLPAYRAGRKR
jgi:hypothetical protein